MHQVRQVPRVLGNRFQVGHRQNGDQDRPQMDLHGLSRRSDETLGVELLLEVSEKYFNFPTGLVKISYRTGSKFRVIGQQFDGKSVFFVEDC